MRKLAFLALFGFLLIAGCSNIQINLVPTSADKASDAASAQSALPNLSNYGYIMTNTQNLTDALTAVGAGAQVISGNPATAAMIAKIGDMVNCYQSVGAIAAGIYTDANISQLATGSIPKVGALGIVNTDRVARDLLPCALNTGAQRGFAAQDAQVQPCSSSGSFTRQGEHLSYIYAATDPQLCALFQAALDAS